MDFNQIHKIFFLGAGGIGMSALARYFNKQGKEIFGYDLTATPLTNQLISEGVSIQFDENINTLPEAIDLVIYTPAIPTDNQLYSFYSNSNIPILKRSEVLGLLSENLFTIAIAGTHGKTSISAITAHLLKSSGLQVTALIGGICKNYNSNTILSENSEYMLLEADEFDKSFLTLKPDIAVISSMDADHLDIYNNKENLVKSFKEFANQIKPQGTLICNSKLKPEFTSQSNTIYYGINSDTDIIAENIRIENGQFVFDFVTTKIRIDHIKLTVPGMHYIENTLAAAAIGYELGLNGKQIKQGIESFIGITRRFETRYAGNVVYIDDYAHHPEEIKVTIDAVRMLYPNKRIIGAFQPHLYSRTRDFADDFATVLSQLDEVILLDIYPAREEPIPGVSSEMILEKIENQNKRLLSKTELLKYFETIHNGVILTLGAGDIGLLADEIENELNTR